MTEHPSALTIATRLHTRGLSVFPVPRPGAVHDGKTPVLPWKRYQREAVTRRELATWFATPQNIAVITGAISGVVVIDVDDGAAWQWAQPRLPETPWRVLTGKGLHLYFRHPGVPVANRVHVETLPLDVRGDGGYVIGPGSVHASGVRYRCRGDWRVPRAELPVFSPAWLPPSVVVDEEATNQPPRAPVATTDAVTRARAYLAAVPRPEIGCGSDQATFTAACRLVRGFALSSADAEALLWDWCGNRPGWTRQWLAVKVASAETNGKELIGALL